MTVMYSALVAKSSNFGFIRTLLIWKGSVWKLIHLEMLIWSFFFVLFTLVYRFVLTEEQQRFFEAVCIFCHLNVDLIPFEFILGYYIALVISRWASFWISLGFIDSVGFSAATYLRYGDPIRAQIYRRNIIRLVCLYQIMVYRAISPGVRKMYPTFQSLVEAGYINENEVDQFADNKFWMPIKWSMFLVRDARKEGLIENDFGVQHLYQQIAAFRSQVIKLWLDDWVPIPLAYSQIALLSIRIYFLILIFSRQFWNTTRTATHARIDIYVQILTLIQFILYVGWCKIGETLINPFGNDDDDFDYKFILSRNLNVGMDIVTGLEAKQPTLIITKPSSKPKKLFEGTKPIDVIGSVANINVRRHSSGTPLIMVKRSEANILKPSQVRRFRSNSIAVPLRGTPVSTNILSGPYGNPETDLEAAVENHHRNRRSSGISKQLVPPKVFVTQHSCPSQFAEENISRWLATVKEADESSSGDNSDTDENKSVSDIMPSEASERLSIRRNSCSSQQSSRSCGSLRSGPSTSMMQSSIAKAENRCGIPGTLSADVVNGKRRSSFRDDVIPEEEEHDILEEDSSKTEDPAILVIPKNEKQE
ncbi:unnamed protein product [Enterobius vermicularis]|uniref:Bestrophin homolog n=1 Tax=Enterobius vermicularis TaxID=51028 RepID=A0A0N4V1X8_ENTVE|nr:unnamed protein product [Enterobius vermicularis]